MLKQRVQILDIGEKLKRGKREKKGSSRHDTKQIDQKGRRREGFVCFRKKIGPTRW
jgi:hypothetical protein